MYNTSQEWKEKIYTNVQSVLNIYVGEELINPDYILDFKVGHTLFDDEELKLGNVSSKYIEFKIYKDKMPSNMDTVKVDYGILINNGLTVAEVNAMLVGTLDGIKVKSLAGNNTSFEMIPIGIFNVDDWTDNDDNTLTIKCIDNMSKFEFNYDGSSLTYPATLLEILEDICNKAGVGLGSTSFLNSDTEISVYDNTITAREYLSYISECAGGFAFIGRDGKLYIRTIYQDEQKIPFELLGEYKWGDKCTISKVSYENGVESFKTGNDTGNNLWLNQENMYIVEENEVENIYNKLNGLEAYSFEGKTIIDPALDVGDRIIIDNKSVIFQGELDFQTRFIAEIDSKIATKEKQETTVKKTSQKVINRRVQSRIDEQEGKITQLIEENTETSNKLTQVEQTVDGINQKVENIQDLTLTVDGITSIELEKCIAGYLLELHIYGNNSVFSEDSQIELKDKDNNVEIYELGISEVLRQNGEICDEYILQENKASVIRRVNKDGTIKTTEEIEDLGEFQIDLKEGTNTIKIKNYQARLRARYVAKNEYSDVFVPKVELGTEIEQNAEAVKIAWNQIAEFIQMMIINNNASLAILDKDKRVMMSLDKEGLNFYKNGETEPFGEMGVKKVDEQDYISFSVLADYDSSIQDGMAWGVTNKETGKFFPILYISNFYTGPENSEVGFGQLVLAACDLLLDTNASIKVGDLNIQSGILGDLIFSSQSSNETFLHISPPDVTRDYPMLTILDNINFYKNQGGSNSFKIGNGSSNYCLFTDNGNAFCSYLSISKGTNGVYIEADGKISGNEIYFYSLPSYQGDKLVYGRDGHSYYLRWTGSQLDFYVDFTNVGTLSDRRLKTDIENIDDNFIKAIEEIEMKQFKVANRNGLISFGILAQDLIEIFKKYGKEPFDYEIVYKTEYKSSDATIYYAINYEQFLILKQKATDKKLKKLQEKDKQKDKLIQNLIKRIEKLEEGKE